MTLYPLMANLENRPVLIVGGGGVATRKVRALLETGARVRVVSERFSPELGALSAKGVITTVTRPYEPEDLSDCALVFAATDDPQLNDEISDRAMARGIPVNNITNPEKCTFFVPSRVTRGDLILAISTSGKSPATAKWLRQRLEREFGPEYETLIKWMGVLRDALERDGIAPARISRVSEHLLNDGILEKLKRKDTSGIRDALERAFRAGLNSPAPQPVISRLGAFEEETCIDI